MVVRMPAPVLRDKKSKSYWLRKRVLQRYRDIVGRGEIWPRWRPRTSGSPPSAALASRWSSNPSGRSGSRR